MARNLPQKYAERLHPAVKSSGMSVDAIAEMFAEACTRWEQGLGLDGMAQTVKAGEARGTRWGLEAAAKWHDEEAADCGAVKPRAVETMQHLRRVAGFHRAAATRIRTLIDADLPSAEGFVQ